MTRIKFRSRKNTQYGQRSTDSEFFRRFLQDSLYVYIFERRNHSWKNRLQKHLISKAQTPKPSGKWHIRFSCSQTFYVSLWLFRTHWRTRLEMKRRACLAILNFFEMTSNTRINPHRALNVLITHPFLFSCRSSTKTSWLLTRRLKPARKRGRIRNLGLLQ